MEARTPVTARKEDLSENMVVDVDVLVMGC